MSGNDCDLEIDGSNDSEVMREGGCSDVARSSRDVRCSRTNSDNVAQQGGKGQRLWGASDNIKMAGEVDFCGEKGRWQCPEKAAAWGEREMILATTREKGRWKWPKKAVAWGEREMVVAKDDDDYNDGDGG
ncbi:hypothetical protein BHM03_00008882 [Ensete ventricosum]|nr:hypothetical protein BHM03_00008882 [Ensete ventricosum]